MIKVLVIEDDIDVLLYIQEDLQDNGFEQKGISSGTDLEAVLNEFSPDIILLDYKLPGENGLNIINRLRHTEDFNRVPVIMISGVDDEGVKVAALDSGADDYLVKPFTPNELRSRIKAVLRRVQGPLYSSSEALTIDELKVDLQRQRAYINDEPIFLTPTEFRILREFISNIDQVVQRQHLNNAVFGPTAVVDRTVDVHISSIRKKLESWSRNIITIRGVGFKCS